MIKVASVKRYFGKRKDLHAKAKPGSETDQHEGVSVANDVHHFPAGWWLLPSAALGCFAWFLIFRAIWAWVV